MIDTSIFGRTDGLVSHSLINNWTWQKIEQFKQQQVAKNPAYYREIGNGGYTVGGADCIPEIKTILDYLQPLAPQYYARAGIYVSTQSNSLSFPLHIDRGQHVWIWQVIGVTRWQVGDVYLTLDEDQLLYIRPGTPHRAIPDSPRVSFSISLEEFD